MIPRIKEDPGRTAGRRSNAPFDPRSGEQDGSPTTQGANPITYRLDHRSSGKRLGDEESLRDASVKEDDILSLFPEVTAG